MIYRPLAVRRVPYEPDGFLPKGNRESASNGSAPRIHVPRKTTRRRGKVFVNDRLDEGIFVARTDLWDERKSYSIFDAVNEILSF